MRQDFSISLLRGTFCLALAVLLAVAGCDSSATVPEVEVRQLTTLPYDEGHPQLQLKPGHWSACRVEAVSRWADVTGRLAIEVDPYRSSFAHDRFVISRPTVLPKGQARAIDSLVFGYGSDARSVGARLTNGDREQVDASGSASFLLGHQYLFPVLAGRPEGYRYLVELDSVRNPQGKLDPTQATDYYRVALIDPQGVPALPDQATAWTSTAYLLWDGFDPQRLDPAQQQAIVDWLHWGGQLIVSGPESLELLRNSFLDPYLPVVSAEPAELSPAALLFLNWTPGARLAATRVWSGLRMTPRTGASNPLGGQGGDLPLVLERRVGRGRVLATAFSLAERELIEWPGFDGFFNACLLRRPARSFSLVNGSIAVRWADEPSPAELARLGSHAADRWQYTLRHRPADVEYFSRNTAANFGPDPGAAVWCGNSTLYVAAEEQLRRAAGIEIPPARVIALVLGAYVLLMVPLNWLFFRAVGRAGLTWAAVPVIALAATGGVIGLERLNLGFSRARFEVGVVECQPNYSRSHVTRYTALSASLGTEFRLGFDDPSAVALPLDAEQQSSAFGLASSVELQRLTRPTAEWPASVTLTGFRVASNSLRMLSSEAMLPAAGGFELTRLAAGRYRVVNHSAWSLMPAMLVSDRSVAWIGALPVAASRELQMEPGDPEKLFQFILDRLPGIDADSPTAREKNTSRLLAIGAAEPKAGEVRLVGWTTDEVPGVVVDPKPDTVVANSLIVAHLDYGPLPEPDWDVNLRSDVAPARSSLAP